MKKLLFFVFLSFLLLIGCSVMNTPTKKVEWLLSKYQKKDSEVIKDLDMVMLSETLFSKEQKDRYKDILFKQYEGLKYTIVKETIDGNKATVECNIEVYDFNKAIREAEDFLKNDTTRKFYDDSNNLLTSDYNDYKLDLIDDMKERVTYTIYFTLNKVNDEWIVDDLTESERLKIHGLYAN